MERVVVICKTENFENVNCKYIQDEAKISKLLTQEWFCHSAG